MAESRNTYTIRDGDVGTVKIADELLPIIAAFAATEVDGVSSMSGNLTHDIVRKMGFRTLGQGVRTNVEDNRVQFELSLNIDYGRSIAEVGKEVQERVKNAVETMTGMEVGSVKVRIADVDLTEQQDS